ncbi:MAG: penicillin-binding protein activator [Anaeromyxobacter sp.]|nr:penicillin-binding protein activator [Anaeromyxobacter sp.]
MPAPLTDRSAARWLARAALVALVTSCAPARVVVRGQELPVAEAEGLVRVDLSAERAALDGLPPAERAARLEAFAARYPGVPAAAEAQHEAARAWRAAGDVPRSAAALGRLLVDHPLYPEATQAKYELALTDLELGRARDGLATLGSLYGRLPEVERAAAARATAEAAEAARAWPEAVRWWGEAALRSTAGPAREAALARVEQVVDARLDGLAVARLLESLPQDSPALPTVAMKRCRILVHVRDWAGAEAAARDLLSRWPTSPWAADAQAALDRLARLTAVRPDVVGVAVPLSGPFKRWGEVILQGIGLALGEGAGVRLAIRDTRGEPDGAASAIEQLALEEGAIVVIGGVANAEAERAAATAEELGVPLLSLSKLEGVTEAGPFVFQHMLTAGAQARALADLFMGKRGLKRFAVMYPQVAYGVELAGAFWDEVEARGGEVRAAESYPIDRTTFTPLVKEMVGKRWLDERTDFVEGAREVAAREPDPFRRRKALEKLRDGLAPVVDFDAVLIADFARNVKLITPALAVEDVLTTTCLPDEVRRVEKTTGRRDLRAVQLLGGNGWGSDPSLFDLAPGGAGRHVRCAVFVDGFFAGSTRPETRRFADAYQRKYGAAPSILEASAYDAVKLARAVIEGGQARTRAALRDGLAGVKGFKGATGDLTVGPTRVVEKELFFLTLDRDGLRELTRAELASPGAGGGER